MSGSTAALVSLGRAYYAGGGADAPDYAKALLWLSRGATRLDTRSFYFLGLMFLQGKGVRAGNEHAFVLLDVSARLFSPFTDERAAAFAARDRAREGLTPIEVARAGSTSRRLLKAMLEHRKQTIDDLFPQEALAVLHASR